MTCSACGEQVTPLDQFCEACGASVEVPGGDGARREEQQGQIAAVSDRGHRRARNEDAFSITSHAGVSAAVVCDGVATTARAADASVTAASTALAELTGALADPGTWTEAVTRSVAAAQAALCDRSSDGAARFEGCTTIVSALVGPGRVVVANVGDSRGYWVGRDGSAVLLSTDDTWVREAVAAGMSDEEARASGRGHELTAWLGADAGTVEPHVSDYRPAGEGLLVVCTDGLWNYAESPAEISARVVDRAAPADVARDLVAFALERGGEDNVTVAVAAISEKVSAE